MEAEHGSGPNVHVRLWALDPLRGCCTRLALEHKKKQVKVEVVRHCIASIDQSAPPLATPAIPT